MAQNKKGASFELAEGQKLFAKKRARLLPYSQRQFLEVSANISQSQLFGLQTEASLGGRTKLSHLHIFFLPGQGTLTKQKYVGIYYTSRNQKAEEEKIYP